MDVICLDGTKIIDIIKEILEESTNSKSKIFVKINNQELVVMPNSDVNNVHSKYLHLIELYPENII